MISSRSTPPWSGVILLALGALAYEVLLTRLFAIIQWHHFAYMIISLALLGYGASGAVLVFVRQRWSAQPRKYFALNALAFGVLSVLSFLSAQHLDFNPFELAWGWSQFWKLALVYLLLMLPFFFAANALGLALVSYPGQENRVYSADLLGAGLGALMVILMLFHFQPMQALLLIGGLGCFSSLISIQGHGLRVGGLGLMVLLMISFWVSGYQPQLKLSTYKDISQAMHIRDMQKLVEHSGPLGQFIVTQSQQVPARHAPGLSLSSVASLPRQYSVFIDGNSVGAMTTYNQDKKALSFVADMTSSAAYLFHSQPEVLVLGAGNGLPVLQAVYHNASTVEAVEMHPEFIDLFSEFSWSDWSQSSNPAISFVSQEPRSFIRHTDKQYDLLQLMLVDAYGPGSAGLHALQENYLYTVEAFSDYLQHTRLGGLIAVTRWYESPPRDSLKLLSSAAQALKLSGIDDPSRHVIMLRGWQTVTLLFGKTAFEASHLQAIREFCEQKGFDLSYAPGISVDEVNRFNQGRQPFLYQGATAILSSKLEQWQADYPFDIGPATDDRPYLFHSFRWSFLENLLDQAAGVGKAQLEWGYLVLLASLIVALLGSFFLILLPLWLGLGVNRPPVNFRPSAIKLFAYFSALGLGFMFIEIAFIQQFILLLGHPLYSISIVLTAFLVFAGFGSYMAQHWLKGRLRVILLLIVALLPLYLLMLPVILNFTLGWNEWMRLSLAVLLIAPLAFLMGIPFPIGLARLGQSAPEFAPWAWGINGCTSVIAVILAKLLAMSVGFSMLLVLALLAYLLAAWSVPEYRPAAWGREKNGLSRL